MAQIIRIKRPEHEGFPRAGGVAGVGIDVQLVDGVVGQVVGIVAIGMTARDAEDPLAERIVL